MFRYVMIWHDMTYVYIHQHEGQTVSRINMPHIRKDLRDSKVIKNKY